MDFHLVKLNTFRGEEREHSKGQYVNVICSSLVRVTLLDLPLTAGQPLTKLGRQVKRQLHHCFHTYASLKHKGQTV